VTNPTPPWLHNCIMAAAYAEGREAVPQPHGRYRIYAPDRSVDVEIYPSDGGLYVTLATPYTGHLGAHRCITVTAGGKPRPADRLIESLRRALVVVLAGREEQRKAERRQQAQEREELRRMQVMRGELQALLGSAFLPVPLEKDVRGRAIVRLARDGSVTLEIARLSAREADDILQALSDS
jgi:hypothetical protein